MAVLKLLGLDGSRYDDEDRDKQLEVLVHCRVAKVGLRLALCASGYVTKGSGVAENDDLDSRGQGGG